MEREALEVEVCGWLGWLGWLGAAPCNMLTFTFLEKHVSLNYNPCWCQNVCSLNIYPPRVASEARHRHLEAFLSLCVFFLFPSKVLRPKGNAVKALQTASERRRACRAFIAATPQTGAGKEGAGVGGGVRENNN